MTYSVVGAGAGRAWLEDYIKTHKQNNIRGVLNLIRRRDTFAVAEISNAIRLSKTTVKKTIDLLSSMKLVASAGKGESTEEGGKKPELYRFNKSFGYVISIHITPDSIISVITDLDADITYSRKVKVTSERGLEFILGELVQVIGSFKDTKSGTGEKMIGVVIALPGLVDSAKGVSIYSPHYPSWGRNVAFGDMLRERLGNGLDAPILIENVNRLQAIAEKEKGVAVGVTNFIIIDALDEGLGSGIVTHGELMMGNQSLSGEIGHMMVNPIDGAPCICGATGCFEAMVSAPDPWHNQGGPKPRGAVGPVFFRLGRGPFPRRGVRACRRGRSLLPVAHRRRGEMVHRRAREHHHGERPRDDRRARSVREGRHMLHGPAAGRDQADRSSGRGEEGEDRLFPPWRRAWGHRRRGFVNFRFLCQAPCISKLTSSCYEKKWINI